MAPSEIAGVFYFRENDLKAIPEKIIVHLSADSRYRFYVNGSLVSWGPAEGDVENWNYETVDIASFLKEGKNRLSLQV